MRRVDRSGSLGPITSSPGMHIFSAHQLAVRGKPATAARGRRQWGRRTRADRTKTPPAQPPPEDRRLDVKCFIDM